MTASTRVIDIHSHFYPDNIADMETRFGSGEWPGFRKVSDEKGMITFKGKDFRPIYDACWSASRRIEEMDKYGVDVQIMCATPILFAYAKPAKQSLECARFMNDAALEMCSYDSARLKAMCQVPLQDIDLACAEVSRAMESGHIGVQIGNHVGDKNLDDEGLITFLHHCADIGAPVLIHPWDMMAPERMPKYMLQWLVAMPAETQLSILSLILSGAFERLPKSLKLCFAHGGGSFAYLMGRVDNAWRERDIVRKDCPNLPSSYCDRFYVDSAVFSDDALDLLVKCSGTERVMFGTDYPFPLGEIDMGALVRNHPDLDDTQKSAILGGNAEKFFKLD
ncbi:amidohydrolase family protein [Pseudemcibacter aquimaris]|uniref:amidohydrolase family protein n=1 Tax=Pseudemcibacter aquimaris TaxID=2857064 RepID=UPI0020132224|nr:amidohydrolase family protein [Pseudemcibacter aquimaris]MCC3861238.1 amidohydrolase [Pseudemcibacter aquimaris]WDU58013.1 amidohydrolase [Pseudemcibacter aquimaris]